jgi:hypothetical protein
MTQDFAAVNPCPPTGSVLVEFVKPAISGLAPDSFRRSERESPTKLFCEVCRFGLKGWTRKRRNDLAIFLKPFTIVTIGDKLILPLDAKNRIVALCISRRRNTRQ